MGDDLGKKAEQKIREWLNRPEFGYDFNRIPDQMSGMFMSRNICDFDLYKYPYKYYIESKATYRDRFDFSSITEYQFENLLSKSLIPGVFAVVIVLFATYKRAFILKIDDIDRYIKQGNKKSLNINKVANWGIPYSEIRTIPNNRKTYLDYEGEIEEYLSEEK